MTKPNRSVLLTTLVLLAVAGATVATLRAAEPSGKPAAATPSAETQSTPSPSGTPAVPAAGAAEPPEEGPSRAAPPPPIDESPQFRESADNNITLPVDI